MQWLATVKQRLVVVSVIVCTTTFLAIVWLLPPERGGAPTEKIIFEQPESIQDPLSISDARKKVKTSGEQSKLTPYKPDFILTSTVEGDPNFARAWVKFYDRNVQEFALKEYIGEAQLMQIGHGFIKVKAKGKFFQIQVGNDKNRKLKQADQEAMIKMMIAKAKREYLPANELEDGGSVTAQISRQELTNTLSSQARLFKGIRVKAATTNQGEVKGYFIQRLKEGNLLYKVGARPGDIVHSINDFKLTGTDILFELWEALPTTTQIKLTIQRRKKLIIYYVIVQD